MVVGNRGRGRGRPPANRGSSAAAAAAAAPTRTRRTSGRIKAARSDSPDQIVRRDQDTPPPTSQSDETEIESDDADQAQSRPIEPVKSRRGRPRKVRAAGAGARPADPPIKARSREARGGGKQRPGFGATIPSPALSRECPPPGDVDATAYAGLKRQWSNSDSHIPGLANIRAQEDSIAAESSLGDFDAVMMVDHDQDETTARRRLADLVKQYTSLELRYRSLHDIGVHEAERNFERLKRQAEERAKVANQLISSMKEEVATQAEVADTAQKLKLELDLRDGKIASLEQNIKIMTQSLSDAKAEIKMLHSRLLATTRVPGSAVKGPGSLRPGVMAKPDLVHTAQLKEDLYADLTGLIVRGVKSEPSETVYDCIQTGRNGTLHFKLAIGNETAGESYDELKFVYKPQLNDDRDGDLLEVLPDYLVEEITFPRPHAAKFYSRVTRSLMGRGD